MIQRLITRNSLLNQIIYSVHRKPRDPAIPTHAPIIHPFSINYLHNNPGYRRYPKALGRGPGSGKGYNIINSVKLQEEVSKVKIPDPEVVFP